MKCMFVCPGFYDCRGKVKEKIYAKPCEYWGWPKVFVCEEHNRDIDWKDVLNTKSNVITNNRKMIHTKELGHLQGLDFWVGNCEEIVFCPICNGAGGIEDENSILGIKPCDECKCTGRK